MSTGTATANSFPIHAAVALSPLRVIPSRIDRGGVAESPSAAMTDIITPASSCQIISGPPFGRAASTGTCSAHAKPAADCETTTRPRGRPAASRAWK